MAAIEVKYEIKVKSDFKEAPSLETQLHPSNLPQ